MPDSTTITARSLAGHLRDAAADAPAPFVVAIDGRSGAGKSTLAAALAAVLSAAVMPGDDFFAGGVHVRDDPPEILARDCIDWQRQATALRTLIAGEPATYRPFDWEAFDNSLCAQPVTIAPRPFIIVEGVYAARPELAGLFDYRILKTVSEPERIKRILAREGEIGAWERQWHRAEDWYFATQATPDRFDQVIA